MERAEEAFLTSTTRGVHAIREVNGKILGREPGPITRRLGRAFRALAEAEIDP